jgi:AcrR family transcriptional regulator
MTTSVLGGRDDTSIADGAKRVAIVDGALSCIALKGLRSTTVDDVAQASGLSRATLYRTIPGGRDAIVAAMVETEVARFFSALAVAMGQAESLEEVLVSGVTTSALWIAGSEALATVLEQEPWVVLRHLSFGEMDHALGVAAAFTRPFLGRWLDADQADRAADWVVRIVLSYLLDPDADIDLTDRDSVTLLVRHYVLPGIEALRLGAP